MLAEQMIINIGDMPFVTVPLEHAGFHDHDVIYVILGIDEQGQATVLDVGQSTESGATPMNTPERRACWLRHAALHNLLVGMYRLPSDYCMKEDREKIINTLRGRYHAPCGEV